MTAIFYLLSAICASVVLKFLHSAFTIMKRRKDDALERMDTLYDVDADRYVKFNLDLRGLHAA